MKAMWIVVVTLFAVSAYGAETTKADIVLLDDPASASPGAAWRHDLKEIEIEIEAQKLMDLSDRKFLEQVLRMVRYVELTMILEDVDGLYRNELAQRDLFWAILKSKDITRRLASLKRKGRS